MKHFEENEKVYIGRTAAYYDWNEDDIFTPEYWTWSNDKNSEEFASEVFELTPDGLRHLDFWITCRQMNLWQRKNFWGVLNENSSEQEFYDLTDLKNEFIIFNWL